MGLLPQKLNSRNSEQNFRELWRQVQYLTAQQRRASVDPTATDDNKQGFDIGAIWTNTTTNIPYLCVDNTTSAAVWVDLTSATTTAMATTNILVTDEALAVPATTQTTVATYVSGSDTMVTNIFCSGNDNAKWQVYVNSVLQITQRGSNGDRNVPIVFPTPLLLANGDTLDVKVTHFFTAETLDFETTILGYT